MPHRQSASFLQLNNNNNNAQNSTNYTLQFLSLPLPLIEELVLNLLNEYIAAAARREGLVGVEGEGKPFKTRFHAKALPATGSGTLGEYLHRLIKFTPFSRSVILLSLLYLDRLVRLFPSSPPLFTSLPSSSRTPSPPSSISNTAPPPPLNALTAHRLLLISLSLASKYSTDANFPQERIAKIGGIGKRELTRLEFEGFRLLGWRLTEERGEVEGIAREILGEADASRPHMLELRLEGDMRSEGQRIDQEGGGSEDFERRIPLIPIPLIIKSSPSSVSLISQQETEDSHHSSSSEIDDDESFLEREVGDRSTSIAIRQLGAAEEEDEGRSLARSPTEGIRIEQRRREYLNLSTQPPPAQPRQSSGLTSLFRTKPPPAGPSKTIRSTKDIKTQKVTGKGDAAEVGEGRSLARSPTTGMTLESRRKEYNALALSSQALSETIRLPAVESDTQESGRSLARSPTAGISLEGRRREYSTLASKVDSASTTPSGNGHLFLRDLPSPSPEGLQLEKESDTDAEGEGGGRSLAKSPTSGISLENRRKEYFALEVQARAQPPGESGTPAVNFSKPVAPKVLVPLKSPSTTGSQNQTHLMLPPSLPTKNQSSADNSALTATTAPESLPSTSGGRAFTRAPSSRISSKDRQIEEQSLSAARREASVLTANDDSSSISVSGGGRQFVRAPSSKISSKDRQIEEQSLSAARMEILKSKNTKSLPKVGKETEEEAGRVGAGGRAFGRAPSSKISGRERRVEETLLAAARVKAGK